MFSEKGKRNLERSARQRGPARDIRSLLDGPTVTALFACDENRHVLSGVALDRRPGPGDLHDLLHMRAPGGAILITREGPLSPHAAIAQKLGLDYEHIKAGNIASPTYPLAQVIACIHRFDGWLDRFRGVATKYLSNYLAWHRALEACSQQEPEDTCQRARWPAGTHPTLPIIPWFPRS